MRRYILWLVILILLVTIAWAGAQGNIREEKSVLSGTITAENLVAVGQEVKEGDILASVITLTGPAPAVRATVDGTVVEVLVKPGDTVKTGDVVVKVATRSQ